MDIRERVGYCYKLARREVLYAKPDSPEIIVHGTLRNPQNRNQNIGHAWVEENEQVFDPVLDLIWPKDAYYRFFNAKAEQGYTVAEAKKLIYETGHFGPRHETTGEEAYNGKTSKKIEEETS